MKGTDLQVRDLGSTNGTFLNRTRISEDTTLRDGDLVHFAEYEFRVSRWDEAAMDSSRTIFSNVSSDELSEQLVIGVREFHQMLESQAVVPFFSTHRQNQGRGKDRIRSSGKRRSKGIESFARRTLSHRITLWLGIGAQQNFPLSRDSRSEETARLAELFRQHSPC